MYLRSGLLSSKFDHFAKGAWALLGFSFFNFFDNLFFNSLGFCLGLLEFLNSSKRVYKFHFTGKKRVTIGANVHRN